MIKRIHVRYTLTGCAEGKREAAERAHGLHAAKCPVAKTIAGCVEVTTELAFA